MTKQRRTPEEWNEIDEKYGKLRADGYSLQEAAEKLGVNRKTMSNHLGEKRRALSQIKSGENDDQDAEIADLNAKIAELKHELTQGRIKHAADIVKVRKMAKDCADKLNDLWDTLDMLYHYGEEGYEDGESI